MALQLVVKSAESQLLQTVTKLRNKVGWQALHFHFSKLLEEYKSEYQFKIAVNLIHDLLKDHDGSIYALSDGSIMVLCMDLETVLLEKLIFQLRYLYMDDPLSYDERGEENPNFCTVYDVKLDRRALDALCEKYVAVPNYRYRQEIKSEMESARETDSLLSKTSIPKLMAEEAKTLPIGPQFTSRRDEQPVVASPASDDSGHSDRQHLTSIEQMVATLDMRVVIRRQPVCAVLGDMKIRRVFDEMYVNIAHVRNLLKSDTEFLSNRWLFKYVTSLLDQRMLDLIKTTPDAYITSPISINLNVETVLSSRFNEFDAALKPEAKVSVVIEVPVVDLFADMGAFKAAMVEVHRLGYRMCLDGLTAESFIHIDREKIGVDLVKVQWNADKPADLKSEVSASVKDAVQMIGNNRIILCRCDNRSAVEYGLGLGISLFQGRYLDKLLNPTAKVEN